MDATQRHFMVFPGQLLAGKYRVERVLGEGGMGVVVAATNEMIKQRVAIKLLQPAALGEREAHDRFLREARAAASLRSEHVARTLDAGTLDDGRPYIVMEHLDGCDLGHVVDERGPLPIEDAVGYVLQACEGIAEAAQSGPLSLPRCEVEVQRRAPRRHLRTVPFPSARERDA